MPGREKGEKIPVDWQSFAINFFVVETDAEGLVRLPRIEGALARADLDGMVERRRADARRWAGRRCCRPWPWP